MASFDAADPSGKLKENIRLNMRGYISDGAR